jgi:hypothetical protein
VLEFRSVDRGSRYALWSWLLALPFSDGGPCDGAEHDSFERRVQGQAIWRVGIVFILPDRMRALIARSARLVFSSAEIGLAAETRVGFRGYQTQLSTGMGRRWWGGTGTGGTGSVD